MPVPASINDLSTTAGNNSPAGSESPTTTDDYLRTHAAFIAALRDENASQASSVTALQTGKQPLDATLTALADVVTAANKLIYATGADAFATTNLTAFARTLLDDANAAEALATLGAVSSADVDAKFTGTNASLTANGYQKLPSGLIIQWGVTASIAGNGSLTVTLPIAFTSGCLGAYATLIGGTSIADKDALIGSISSTQIVVRNNGSNSSNAAYWFAIGI